MCFYVCIRTSSFALGRSPLTPSRCVIQGNSWMSYEMAMQGFFLTIYPSLRKTGKGVVGNLVIINIQLCRCLQQHLLSVYTLTVGTDPHPLEFEFSSKDSELGGSFLPQMNWYHSKTLSPKSAPLDFTAF